VTYRSSKQPYCLWCHKRIPKTTTHHLTSKTTFEFTTSAPVTLEDLKKLTNEQIVSVKYHYENESYEDMTPAEIYAKRYVRHVSGRRTIYAYTTWDGLSYKDEFFCNGEHARTFGYAAARHGLRFKKKNAA
jgi:hypothetical protein